jgi:hypothetical protein
MEKLIFLNIKIQKDFSSTSKSSTNDLLLYPHDFNVAYPIGKKSLLSTLKVKCFQPDFAIFFACFLPTEKRPQNSKRPLNSGK